MSHRGQLPRLELDVISMSQAATFIDHAPLSYAKHCRNMTTVSNGIENLQIDPKLGPESPTEIDFASFAAEQTGDTLPFYEVEAKILALWDQLNDLKLEIALQEAQNNPDSGARKDRPPNRDRD